MLLLLVALSLPPPPAWAQEISIDHRQVAYLVRALGYESHLRERAGLDIHIGVVGKADLSASQQAARAMTLAFQELGNVTIQGLPVKASPLTFSTAAAFDALLERKGIDVLYICSGLDGDLRAILEMTARRQILSIGSQAEYLKKGASLGVFAVDGGLKIFVNFGASKKEGAAFASDLLRLARVVK